MSKELKPLSRRLMLQAFVAVPALSLFRAFARPDADDTVEVNGWILKRSEVA